MLYAYILQVCTRWNKHVVLSYVDDCIYWYKYKVLGKWFMDTLGKRLYVRFLIYAHWFISIMISQMKEHSISVYRTIYYTSIVDKYLDTTTVKTSKKFYSNTFPSERIFTRNDLSASDEKVEKLSRQFNIHYRSCIGSLIICYLQN